LLTACEQDQDGTGSVLILLIGTELQFRPSCSQAVSKPV